MPGVEGRQAGGTHPSILIHMTISMQNPEPNQRRVKIIHSSWGLVVLALVLAGAGIYEAVQNSQLRERVQTLQQQQMPLAEEIEQLRIERDKFARQSAALGEENERLKRNSAELPKLRGEIGVLRRAVQDLSQANSTDASLETAARSWLNRANQLINYVNQNPEENIPELQFLTEREWLIVSGDTGLETDDFKTADDFRRGAELLRIQAESRFALKVQEALRKYASANNGEFPDELSRLLPYCESSVGELLVHAYEIKPSTVLSASRVKDLDIKTDWVITRKKSVNSNSRSRLAIFANGDAYWQSPP